MKKRLLTGIILVSLMAGLIFLQNSYIFRLAIFAMIILGAWEYSGLMMFKNPKYYRIFYIILLAGITLLSTFFVTLSLYLALFFWTAVLGVIYFCGKCPQWHLSYHFKLLAGFFCLFPFYNAMIMLHTLQVNVLFFNDRLPWLLVMPILIIIFSDTGAYFFGKKFGKEKLLPTISPNKTWEGLFGGILCGGGIGIVSSLFIVEATLWMRVVLVFGSILLVLVALIGDLFESLLKRQAGVKDSGKCLPGHGGILDRLDSWFAAIPIFALLILIFQY